MHTYDIETYPNAFTCWFYDGTNWYYYEISTRRNDLEAFRQHCMWLSANKTPMVGYNNIGFDYPVIHHILTTHHCTVDTIYQKAESIIDTPWDDRFVNIVRDPLIPQIDLYKIKHYDNLAKSTRLKYLEFVMRMGSIQDLPIAVGTWLTDDQIEALAAYNKHDVQATHDFLTMHCLPDLELRKALSDEYGVDMTNFNDSKMGSVVLEHELQKAGVPTKGKTFRNSIVLNDIILPYVSFAHSEFNRVLHYLKSQTLVETKGAFKDLSATCFGIEFIFGTGGIHASIENGHVHAEEGYQIVDVDVASYYPNLAISNRWYPDHLSEVFCDVYQSLYEKRKTYPKGSPQNAALKLALNGTYGNSNSKYSNFYDPQFTMSITVNGQLLLCMLAEHLAVIPTCKLIQANTDGVTVSIRDDYRPYLDQVCRWWEKLTGLILEAADYSDMWIRDVNNYIARYTNGKFKRKGAYEYDRQPHQNHSGLIVPKAAFAQITGEVVQTDDLDYLQCAKVPRSSRLEHGTDTIQPISRYCVTTTGEALTKVMPPLKGKEGERRIGIDKTWLTTIVNDLSDSSWTRNVDHRYYNQEIEKLVTPVCRHVPVK